MNRPIGCNNTIISYLASWAVEGQRTELLRAGMCILALNMSAQKMGKSRNTPWPDWDNVYE